MALIRKHDIKVYYGFAQKHDMKNGLRLRLLISFHIQHLADTYRIKEVALEFGSRYQTIRQMEFKKSPLRRQERQLAD